MKKKGTIRICDEVREKVKIMAIEGHSVRYIAKSLSISSTAVHRIKKEIDNLEQLRTNKKEEIVKKLWDIAKNALESITDKKIRGKKMTAYSIMLTAAVAIDKAQLLSGDATEILGVKTDAELDREWKKLDQAERELKLAWDRAMAKRKAEEKEKAKGGQS